MPQAAASATRGKSGKSGGSPVQVVPFTAAAHEHVEPAFDVSITPGANAVTLGPFDVPAYGYLRHIWLLVEGTGGTGGTAAADAPWNVFQEVTLLDVNGAPIFGPYTGYNTFLANLFGGYVFRSDPRKMGEYVPTAPNLVFAMRIPIEILHNNGLGSLSNQNAAASYKVRLVINPSTVIFSVAPSPLPTFRIRGFLEAWSQPTDRDLAGRPQATAPPSHGTTQYWSYFNKAVSAGDNVILLPRVGNLIRTLIFVARDGSGVRQSVATMPDPLEIRWDARQLIYEPRILRRAAMAERFDYGIDTMTQGVIVYDMSHDVLGHGGDGTPELWLPTVQSTRLEFHSTGFSVGSVDVLTNDVAPAEVYPGARYDEGSATGFHPAGITVAGSQ